MDRNQFSDGALVLVGHGSTVNSGSAAPVYQHAAALRQRNCFAEVREAFWKQEPLIRPVVSGLQTTRVFIVPLLVSEGYFSEVAIPRELGFEIGRPDGFDRVLQRGSQKIFYCKPVGTHPSMTKVLLARARGVVESFPFPRPPRTEETTLFIAGHGTRQNENSRQSIEKQVEMIRRLGLYAQVHPLFLEEEPKISDCYKLAQTRNLVVVPFFVSDGMHTQEDIPMLLGEPERIVQARLKSGQSTWRNPTERQGKLVWYTASVGTDPLVAEVILERVLEAAGA